MFELHPQLENDMFYLGDFPLCRILLMNESQFPWLILVPARQGVSEIYQLEEPDLSQVHVESVAISRLMMGVFEGDSFNVAALGNMVPQLHIHHVVRRKTDASWPRPIWGNYEPKSYTEDEVKLVLHALIEGLANADVEFTPV